MTIGMALAFVNVALGVVTIGIVARKLWLIRVGSERRRRAFGLVLVVVCVSYLVMLYSLLLLGLLPNPLPPQWGRPMVTMLVGAVIGLLLRDA